MDKNDTYDGKSLLEIMNESKAKRREDGTILQKDVSAHRERMLTVQKLIDYLKTQNPNACIMAYEPNSFAFIEQMPELPNGCVRTVKEDIEESRKYYLEQWYRDDPDKERKCEEDIAETYRYCKDDDVIIRF